MKLINFRIWKCIEYILVNHTYLMKDHHLDQILLCSIFTILKIKNKKYTFNEILHHYLTQPQAKSIIYYQVKISMLNVLLHNPTMSVTFNISMEEDKVGVLLNSIDQNLFEIEKSQKNQNIALYIVNNEMKEKMSSFFTDKQLNAMKDFTSDIIKFYNKV